MAKITGSFDAPRPQAEEFARKRAAKMVTAITEETRAALRLLVVRSIRDGIPVYDAARIIREMIGLSERQAAAAQAYRTSLIDVGLPIAKADKLFERYTKKAIATRAKTIARTEIIGALNAGKVTAAREARALGYLGGETSKTWVATPGACPLCNDIDGETVLLGESFSIGLDAPPAHPNCRCSVVINP